MLAQLVTAGPRSPPATAPWLHCARGHLVSQCSQYIQYTHRCCAGGRFLQLPLLRMTCKGAWAWGESVLLVFWGYMGFEGSALLLTPPPNPSALVLCCRLLPAPPKEKLRLWVLKHQRGFLLVSLA